MTDLYIRDVRAFGRMIRRIERTGQVLLTVWIAFLVALGITWPEPYARAWELVLFQIVAGRAASVGIGMDAGFSNLFLLLHCTLQDVIILLLLYPVVVAGDPYAVERRVVGAAIAHILAGSNTVVATPTASGKSLISWWATCSGFAPVGCFLP